jgi:hypothetical protein
MDTGVISWGVNRPGLKLTTHLYLALRLRIHGARLPLHHTYAWRGAYVSARVNFTFNVLCDFLSCDYLIFLDPSRADPGILCES